MRPMEHGTRTAQRDADPASGALADFGPGGAQHRLDVSPAQIGGVGSAKIRCKVR